jgi:endonuclease YncB( thermonuclease family)
MKKLLPLGLALLFTSLSPALAQETPVTPKPGMWITGTATVLDGDSIEVDGQLIRIYGIDAPELEQDCYSGNMKFRCGAQSSTYLSDMIYGQPIRCQVNEIDKYDRILGSCMWQGRNVAEIMVLTGQALAWPHHSNLYVETEEAAREQGAGIWSTDFARPHEWRQAVARKKAKTKKKSYPRRSAGGNRKIPTFSPN